MNKKVVVTVLAIIIGVAGFLLLTEPETDTTASDVSNHTLGAGTANVTLQEYGDFQCPACAAYYPILKQVKDKYGDQITFQFSHFPLEAIHKNARASSRAAEAAGMQGKFWEMHDKLYETQTAWAETGDPLSIFEGYARDIGVADLAKFTSDYRSSEVNAVINADLDAGRDKGVSSTPTFLVNGSVIESPSASLEAFSEVIDAALTNSSQGEETEEISNENSDAIPEE